MSIVDDPKNKAAIAVYNALPSNEPLPGETSDPDAWSTVDAVAKFTGLKPGTVSELLRKMERTDRIVEKYRPGAAAAVWRRLGPLVEHVDSHDAPAESPNGGEPAETAAKPRSGRRVGKAAAKPDSAGSGDVSGVPDAKPAKPRKAAATPAGPKREPVGDCTRCGKPVVKVGRKREHANARTEAAADHTATTSALAGRKPMTGTCTVCASPMTKNGKTWEHDKTTVKTAGHRATSAQPKTTSHRKARETAEANTYVGADLGEMKAALVARVESAGLTIADGIRAAVAAYLKTAPRKAKA